MATSNFVTLFNEASTRIRNELAKVYKAKFDQEKIYSYDSQKQKDLLAEIERCDRVK